MNFWIIFVFIIINWGGREIKDGFGMYIILEVLFVFVYESLYLEYVKFCIIYLSGYFFWLSGICFCYKFWWYECWMRGLFRKSYFMDMKRIG